MLPPARELIPKEWPERTVRQTTWERFAQSKGIGVLCACVRKREGEGGREAGREEGMEGWMNGWREKDSARAREKESGRACMCMRKGQKERERERERVRVR